MSDLAPLMNSEEFNYLIKEVGDENFMVEVENNIPEYYDTVPSNENFSGPYNFGVLVPPSRSSVYSERLEKLFVKMSSDFTIRFTWNHQHKTQFYIRVKPRFTSDKDANKPVKRCMQHSYREDFSNRDVDEHVRHYVIRCPNTQAQYDSGSDQHFNIRVPLHPPEPGSEFTLLTYQFVCQSSCSTGMNRRPIQLVFTLEDEHGEIHGRKHIHVRICSCPKRDMEKEEKELEEKLLDEVWAHSTKTRPRKRIKITKRFNPLPDREVDKNIYSVTINVVGLHNKKALLKSAFDLLSGDLMLHPGNEHIYKPFLDDILNDMNNC